MKKNQGVNKKSKIILLLIGMIIFISCAEKKEKRLIDDYHKKAIEIKGDSALFISKETVNNFMQNRYNIFNIDDVKVGDNISFFDSKGNIFYQVNCVDINDRGVYVKCLNLTSKEYYETLFEMNNIIDLKGKEIESIKVFRKK